MQCVAVCCSVLQQTFSCGNGPENSRRWVCVAVCFSVLSCVAVCCSVLQHALCCGNGPENSFRWVCAALRCSYVQCVAVRCSCVQCVSCGAMCCGVLQCVAVRFSVLQLAAVCWQCVAVCCRVRIITLFMPGFYPKQHMITSQHVATRYTTLQHVATRVYARILLADMCNHHDYVMSHLFTYKVLK